MKQKIVLSLLIISLTQANGAETAAIPLPPPAEPAPAPKIDSEWQSWTFAAVALVTSIAGVFVISVGNGKSAPDHR